VAIYAAIARTPTPALDRAMRRLSRAADHSKISMATSAALAVVGGRKRRRSVAAGITSIAVTSAVVNVAIKPVLRRRRPDRVAVNVPIARHVAMPISRSFPSGHSASAFAFATGVGHDWPQAGLPLHGLAAAVAYSRIHTGVHYPGDVVAGSLLGAALAQVTAHALDRRRRRR
jgi:undecaprenyl-diphosphatase